MDESINLCVSVKKMKVGDPVSNWVDYNASWEDESNMYKFRKILYDEDEQKAIVKFSVKNACDSIEKELNNGAISVEKKS